MLLLHIKLGPMGNWTLFLVPAYLQNSSFSGSKAVGLGIQKLTQINDLEKLMA